MAGFTPDAPAGFTPDAGTAFTPDAAPAAPTPTLAPAKTKSSVATPSSVAVNVPEKIPHVNYDSVQPHNKPTNQDPRKGKYAWNEHLGGFNDAPYVMANAMKMDSLEGSGTTHRDTAAHLLITNPGAAGATYGLNSETVLKALAKSKDPLDSKYATYLLAHPHMAGALTYWGEWLNPMGWVEGGMIGKGVGKVLSTAPAKKLTEPVVNAAMKMLSAYGPILAAPGHGPGVRNIMATAGTKMALAENRGHKIMMDVFDDQHYHRQVEIIRRQQGLTPEHTLGHETIIPHSPEDREITRRALLLRKETLEMTRQKLIKGTLKADQVYGVKSTKVGNTPTVLKNDKGEVVGDFPWNPGTYHGVSHHFDHPNPAHNELLKTLDTNYRSSTSTSTYKLSDKHADIDMAMKDPLFNHDEHDPAESVRSFFSTGYKKIEFEDSLREIADKFPDAIFIPKTEAERQAWVKGSPALALGGQYLSLRESMSAFDVKHASPTMYNMLISKPMHDFLSNKSMFDTMVGRLDLKGTSEMGKYWNSYNSMMRSVLLANPGFHPFWNIATNTAGAMGKARMQSDADSGNFARAAMGQAQSPVDAMLMYTRAMLGTGASVMDVLGHKIKVGNASGPAFAKVLDQARVGLENRALRSMVAYHKGLDLAEKAGIAAEGRDAHALAGMRKEAEIAGAEFGRRTTAFEGAPAGLETGSTTGRMYTQPKLGKDPATGKFLQRGLKDYIDQHLTAINDWNREATFGPRGEQGFSVTLYHYLKDKLALDDNAAAWATREALGNYRNVRPSSWQSKWVFFYPWLKTDVPLWFKILTGSPQFIAAPTMASRVERETAGDPNAYDPTYSHPGIQLYEKPDAASGTGHGYTVPLPINAPMKIGQSAYELVHPTSPGGIGEGMKGLMAEGVSRMKPGVGLGWDTAMTAVDPKGSDPGTFQGSHTTMFDQRAPGGEQYAQLAKSVAIGSAPFLAPFVTREILQKGFDSTKMGEYILEAAGLGYISERIAGNFRDILRKQDEDLQRAMNPLNAAKAHGGISEYEYNKGAKFYYGLYAEQRRALRQRITDLRKKGGDTGGFTADGAKGFVPDVRPL